MSTSDPETTECLTIQVQTPSGSCPTTPPVTPTSALSQSISSLETTPLKAKLSSVQPHSVGPISGPGDLYKYREELAAEMDGHYVEIDTEKFLESFVPGSYPTDVEKAKFAAFNGTKFDEQECFMYKEFCRVTQSVLSVCHNKDLTVKETGDWEDPTDKLDSLPGNRKRPDVIFYPTHGEAEEAYRLSETDIAKSTSKTIEERKLYLARVRWAWMCVPVEFKADVNRAPFWFSDHAKNFVRQSKDGKQACGQIADYAAKLLRRQHRQFCFMIVICRRRARLLRWDRAGLVASKPFEFVENPETLFTFIFRLGNMSAVQRGYDPTAVLATKAEVELMEKCKDRVSAYYRRCLEEAMEPGWPIYKISVPSKDLFPQKLLRRATPCPQNSQEGRETDEAIEAGGKPRHFLVGKRRFASDSPTGRGTKGYVAYDMSTGKLVFFKDTWRIKTARPELDVYKRLWTSGVKHFATPIGGGDVCDVDGTTVQRTRTQEFDADLPERIHYRLIVEEVGRPLEEYEAGFVMVKVILDALKAHRGAWEKAAVLHRDISVGNILIYDEPDPIPNKKQMPRGFLNDWDLCKYKEELDNGATRVGRSGTWQFMSALLLKYPGRKKHEVSDDLESFVHLVNWLCLRFHQRKHPAFFQEFVTDLYDARKIGNDGQSDVGGEHKLLYMQTGRVMVEIEDNSPLRKLIHGLADLCREHYASIKLDQFQSMTTADTTAGTDTEGENSYSASNSDVDSESESDAGSESGSDSTLDKDSDAVRVLPPKPSALDNHKRIIKVVKQAVLSKGWVQDKGHDHFARFVSSSNNAKLVRSSEASAKRKSEGSTEDPPKAKRSRRRAAKSAISQPSTQSHLPSVSLSEDFEDS